MAPVSAAPAVVCALLASAPAAAQEWWSLDQWPMPGTPAALATDTARGRIVLLSNATYIVGGLDTWEWDGRLWVQAETAVRPPVREGAALSFDSVRGRCVLFGGVNPGGYPNQLLDDTWEWDGAAWRRIQTPAAPPPRMQHAMAYDPAAQRTVLLAGRGASGVLNDTWEYDGATWTRCLLARPLAFVAHSLCHDAARGVLVAGASGTGQTWEWNGSTWLHVATAHAPPPRGAAAMAYDHARQRVVLFGGIATGSAVLGDTWEYDGVDWTAAVPATGGDPSARYGAGMAWDPVAGRLLLFGGNHVNGTGPYRDVWSHDGTWRPVPQPDVPPMLSGMAYDSHRRVLVVMSWPAASTVATTWEYDGTWRPFRGVPPSAGLPFEVPMAFVPTRGRTVLVTGNQTTRTLEWDGAAWQEVVTATRQTPRYGQAMTYDATRDRVVVFGGRAVGTSAPEDETWEYDGVDWTQRPFAVRPPPREWAAMGHDPVRQRIVLFGGEHWSIGTVRATWEYDGNAWSQRFPATSPPARIRAALVHDPVRGGLVLLGGQSYPGFVPQEDAWLWDGTDWRLLGRLPGGGAILRAVDTDLGVLGAGSFSMWRLTDAPASGRTASGSGCGTPEPRVRAGGRPYLGNRWFQIYVEPTPPSALVAVLASTATADLPFGNGCRLLLRDPALCAFGSATATGHGRFGVPVPPAPALRGCAVHLQAVVGMAGGPLAGVAAMTGRRTLLLGL